MARATTSQSDAADSSGVNALIGTIVAARYHVLSSLGAGGMAHVFLAEQLSLGRKVALKVLRSEIAESPQQLERFLREAKAASNIHHPNVVEVIDFGRLPDDSAYLVMEYLRGKPLDEVLAENGPMPWSDICSLMPQAMRALEAAHAKRIIHRDIKPSNCILLQADDGSDLVKVIDFGIAKVVEPDGPGAMPGITRSGAVFGTPNYMSPEQAEGTSLDHRSDIYSMGVMLFELVTGRLPFEGAGFVEVAHQHISRPAPSIFDVAPHLRVPASAAQLIARALSKAPGDRQQTMRELAAELADTAGDPSQSTPAWSSRVAATRVEPDQRTAPTRKRLSQRTTIFVIGGGLLSIAATAIVVMGNESASPSATSTLQSEAVDASRTASSTVTPASPTSQSVPPATPSVAAEAAAVTKAVLPTTPPKPPAPVPAQGKRDNEAPHDVTTTKADANPKKNKRLPSSPDKEETAGAPGSVAPEPEATRVELPFLTNAQIDEGLDALTGALTSCRTEHGAFPGTKVSVQLTIAGGTVIKARAINDREGTPLGNCVAQATRAARFPQARSRMVQRDLRL